MRYYVGGEGEPLLLLHGLAGSSGNWVELLPDLVRALSRARRRSAGTRRLRTAPRGTSIGDFAAVAAAVLEAEAPGPALVAGHSFGGLVALRLARADLSSYGAAARLPGRDQHGDAKGTGARPRLDDHPARALGGALAPPLRRTQWYRRAVFRPWFVSDAAALTPRATHGLLGAQREHTDTKTAGAR